METPFYIRNAGEYRYNFILDKNSLTLADCYVKETAQDFIVVRQWRRTSCQRQISVSGTPRFVRPIKAPFMGQIHISSLFSGVRRKRWRRPSESWPNTWVVR